MTSIQRLLRGGWWPWSRAHTTVSTARAEPVPGAGPTPGVYLALRDLLALEHPVRRLRWPARGAPVHSQLAGRHRARVRGRGLDFIELRQYLPGDDTRSIDWRASVRSGRTQLRVYNEEREHPTWLVVDQRISMFFARRGALRSVVAGEAAAVWGWRALAAGDRVGGIVFGDNGIDAITPGRGRRSLLRLLDRLVARNRQLHADTPCPANPEQFDLALAQLLARAPRDAVIVVLSNFDGMSAHSREQLIALARHNDLVLLPIHDDPGTARPVRLVVTDGSLQLPLDHTDESVRCRLADLAHARMEGLLALRSEIGCVVLPLTTSEPALLQLARRMASPAARAPHSHGG
ncbi:DUF58 domain-containing protein [Thauera mechernichensis]|uniref:DUF58 domain-containing protein n=1 Tax=Thauera mechernichensis TaxID=82788 RepID=A0ABW3WCL2_9RHOO|nr:DUF58 domain-containing protein [Thauera mechernichensis]MDG3066138.1 DUF58 domain-containing protein [Thauera mechernichensis]